MIIIEQPWGGLGDNLQFSTLPEVGNSLGVKVFISNRNTYRNPDIKKLVWDTNPFIAGFTDAPGNLPPLNIVSNNHIINWETTLFGTYKNIRPKLYYAPIMLDEFKTETVIDPNAISRVANFQKIVQDNPDAIILNSDSYKGKKNIKTENIFQWVSIMYSARDVICQYSGSSVTMSALNKKCKVYLPPNVNPNCGFMLPPHDYIR